MTQPNPKADSQSQAEALRQQIHDVLKDLANESWREGHNEEPGNEVGYWIKEAMEAIEPILAAYAAPVEREARIDELKQLDFDTVADRRATITFGQVEARLAALQGPQDGDAE